MGQKMTCPGCDSHTSSVLYAFENGKQCPNCGLSAAATLEIQTVRRAQADAQLKEKYEQAIKERDSAQQQLIWSDRRLAHLEGQLGELLERLRKPLQEEAPDRQDW